MANLDNALKGACREWRSDLREFTRTGEGRKEFLDHLSNCSKCAGTCELITEQPDSALQKIGQPPLTAKAKILEDKKVLRIKLTENRLEILFNNDITLIVEARSGPGLDSEWYTWTEVTLRTPSETITLIDE